MCVIQIISQRFKVPVMQSVWATVILVFVAVLRVEARNVLLIFGDDVGPQMGAYGNKHIHSPNLDALAFRSVIFENGFTSVSSCSPSRSVLLTGLPQHQNGMYGLHHGSQHFQSFDDVRCISTILKSHGIFTGLIGKKHVGPDTVYMFDYEKTEPDYSLLQIGRNITLMKEKVREFLSIVKQTSKPFMLYVAPHDSHRCDPYNGKLGNFCENFGDGMTPDTGVIPDWKPTIYDPSDVEVPYYLPDTPATRGDIAALYKTYSRLDQGVGLFLKELENFGFVNDTLVMYTGDNGIPFPWAKTNLYDPGMGEPFLVSSPNHKEMWGHKSDAMVSTMDIVPTILDWFQVPFPNYKLFGKPVKLTGKSILPALIPVAPPETFDHVFSSHNFHEVTMNYPMRVVRYKNMKLIHNLNHRDPYPLATDLYMNPTFLDILNRTVTGKPLPWFTTLKEYYYRDQWQLFNLTADPHELNNVVGNPEYRHALEQLTSVLAKWLTDTNDPWRCLPGGELEGDTCYPLHNDESDSFHPMYLKEILRHIEPK